ncbi:MAG: hypothetical protein P8Y24_11840 [Gammaproteobacteria bacterium]
MPYYVYKILPSVGNLVKNLELQDSFVKQKRIDQAADDQATFKVMFAETELEAEEKLMEHREETVVREWEK